jgi:hypothetical protein
MNTEVIAIICSFLGSALGTFGGIITSQKLTNYRLKQLEEKVSKHNNLVERMTIVEKDIGFLQSEIAELK